MERSILSLISNEFTKKDFPPDGTSKLEFIEISSLNHTQNTGNITLTNDDGDNSGNNSRGFSSGLSQAAGISSIAVIATVLAAGAFLVKRNIRRKREATSGSFSPGKVKNRGDLKPKGTEEEEFSDDDDDDDQGVEDPVKSKYYNLQQRRANFLSTISEVSEETDSSILHIEDPEIGESMNRILSESTYEYNTDSF